MDSSARRGSKPHLAPSTSNSFGSSSSAIPPRGSSDRMRRTASGGGGGAGGARPGGLRRTTRGKSPAAGGGGVDPSPRKTNTKRLGRFVSSKVASRHSALNVAGGVKVDVFVRCRPLNERELAEGGKSVVLVDSEKKEVSIADVPDKKVPSEPMVFDEVFGPDKTQEDIYNVAVQPVVDQVVRGLSCCLFAYGQTGTGKTFTMLGDLGDPSRHGIVVRSVNEMFERLQSTYDDVRLRMTYMELYNEQLEDLFAAESGKQTLRLVDDSTRGTVCHGLTEIEVESPDQVMALLRDAEKRCRVSETKMNKMSNRAHRIITLLATFTRATGVVHSALTLVDLAGSESVGRSGAEGAMAKEAGNINRSLLTLGRVINALASNEPHIPYRDSKLTRLTSEALGGVCKTSFIATVTPSITDLGETLSTLRYAKNAMEALNISQLPRWKQDEIMIEHLSRRVSDMEQEMKDERDRHKVDEALLQQKFAAMTRDRDDLAGQLERSEANVRTLQQEKTSLQADLAAVTARRDRLMVQKRNLQLELKETRQTRDGYLADRTQLQAVLATVRMMRNRLLEAHQNTERSLNADARALQTVIGSALEDIQGLHSEIARKRQISRSNEVMADEFRDRLSAHLNETMDSVGEFRAEQVSTFEALRESCASILLQRQSHTSALQANLNRLAVSVTEAHEVLASHVSETDLGAKSRNRTLRDQQREFRDALVEKLVRIREQVETAAADTKAQATGLEGQLKSWSDKISTRLLDASRVTEEFADSISADLSGIDSYVDDSIASHLSLLSKHKSALQDHLKSEVEAAQSSAQKLQHDIMLQVERLVAEHTKNAARRVETAVVGFSTSADAMCADAKDMQARLHSRTTTAKDKAAAHVTEAKAAHSTFEELNTAALEATLKTTGMISDVTDTALAQTQSTVGTSTTLVGDHLSAVKDAVKEASAASTAATETTLKKLSSATSLVRTEVDKLSAGQDEVSAELKEKVDGMEEVLDHGATVCCDWTDDHNEVLGETQAEINKHVNEDLERDTKLDPQATVYTYPTTLPSTPAYRTILASQLDLWDREERLSTGALLPGPGVDFGPDAPVADIQRPAAPSSAASSAYGSGDEADQDDDEDLEDGFVRSEVNVGDGGTPEPGPISSADVTLEPVSSGIGSPGKPTSISSPAKPSLLAAGGEDPTSPQVFGATFSDPDQEAKKEDDSH